MKRVAVVFAGLFFCSMLLTGVAHAADKFAYVDLSRLFAEYSKTKDFDKVLGDKEEVYTKERDKKVNEIKSFQDKFNLLSEKEKTAKKTELENKVKGLQEYDRQKQTDLRKEQDDKMKEILKDIEEAVKKYAEKDGYTMVFNDRVLVYQTKNYDITDKVVEILNSGYKK
ncbi:MAG: OmpH family outer membrane protein [Candidatus Omnitrophica bacterium]|nr:OmpH family outer membrane protein [Candidatus Omnitrophota bacterium]